MAAYDDLLQTFVSASAQVLPRLARELVELCDVDDDDTLAAVAVVLARAFMAGAHVGQVEAVAQAAEQGITVQHQILRPAHGA